MPCLNLRMVTVSLDLLIYAICGFNKSRDFLFSLLDIPVTETMENGILVVLNLCMGEEVPEGPVPSGLDGITETFIYALLSKWMASFRLRYFRYCTTRCFQNRRLNVPWLRGWMTEVVFFGR